MPESKAVIGLSWEPKIPNFSSAIKTGIGSDTKLARAESSNLWKPATELVDGLFVPPNDPKIVNRNYRKQLKDTTGSSWYYMPAPTMTPALQKDLQVLKLRNVVDPKRHYKKGQLKVNYFQMGTIIDSQIDFFDRVPKKERKPTFAEGLLSENVDYRKRKVREIEEKNRPGGNEKWKIKGKSSYKHAKQSRL